MIVVLIVGLTMTVLLLPPRAFCNSFVKAESRNGTLTFFPAEFSAKAFMTLPKLDKLWFMAAPYKSKWIKILGLKGNGNSFWEYTSLWCWFFLEKNHYLFQSISSGSGWVHPFTSSKIYKIYNCRFCHFFSSCFTLWWQIWIIDWYQRCLNFAFFK